MIDLQEARTYYPRVSTVIGKQTDSLMREIPIDYLVEASLRGQRIHALCTAYVKGLCLGDIDPKLEPYVTAFCKWADENIQKPLFCLTRLYDDVKRFSGEPDMIVELKSGKNALIDIKTNAAVSKPWDIQLAAYDCLCKANGWHYDEIFIVHLKKKAKKKKEEEQDAPPLEVSVCCHTPDNLMASWDIFASALKCYDYFYRKEPKEKKDDDVQA